MSPRYFLKLAAMIALVPVPALAYPEYQASIVKHSAKPVNCAMCHVHSDGPEGTAPGQIGGFTPEELTRLGQARIAFEPGKVVDNPTLNKFGNHIIQNIGKTKFLELKASPQHLAEVLDPASDLDNDGIPDAREFLEGTHPLMKCDGNPWLLFKTNFQRNLAQIVLTLVATLAGIYGLVHILHGFSIASRPEKEEEE